jgi:hypothetical protein
MSKWHGATGFQEISAAFKKYKSKLSICWVVVDEDLNPICTVNSSSRSAAKHMKEIVDSHNQRERRLKKK